MHSYEQRNVLPQLFKTKIYHNFKLFFIQILIQRNYSGCLYDAI